MGDGCDEGKTSDCQEKSYRGIVGEGRGNVGSSVK